MKSKSKKLLALLLSVMMIVSAIPMTASAALTAGTNTKDVIHFELTASDEFGTRWKTSSYDEGDDETYIDITTPGDYSLTEDNASVSYAGSFPQIVKNNQVNEANMATAIASANAAYQAKNNVEVAKSTDSEDQYVYIGLKTTLTEADKCKGIVVNSVLIKYNSDAFEAVEDVSGNTNPSYALNRIISGNIRITANNTTNATYGSQVINNYSNISLSDSAVVDDASDTSHKAVIVAYSQNTNYYIPSSAEWDVVIPFKVKKQQLPQTTLLK